MDTQDAEEVVRLVFGDHPPDDWRENPEFMQYLSELGNLGADRLTVEPDTVTHQLASVQSSTQELAFSNYKTFIQTSNCSAEICSELAHTEQHLENLTNSMPVFLQKCEQFKAEAAEISRHRALTSLTLSKHTMLLEILELPQLMDTVVRNQHYDEALELHSYVTKLLRKQPDVNILQDICRNVKNSVKLMLQQLLAQLRSSIQLPQCLKVISYLRRLEVFKENELRLKFLQARETWLHSVTNAVPRDDPYIHLTRTMEVMRVHLYDIVTQYRAIFSDDTFTLDTQESDTLQCDNRLLFSSWLSRKIEEFLKILETDLHQTTGSIETLLGQAMYFGLSFSRVGFDFRPILVPVFERIIMKQLNKQLNIEVNAKGLSDSFLAVNLTKIASLKHSFSINQDDVSQPPMLLLDYPPLALVCNQILSALNNLRLCAPVSCVQQVTKTVQQFLSNLTDQTVKYYNTNHTTWNDTQMEGFKKFCSVYKSILLPYLQLCISAVFSPKHLSEISGLSIADLRAKSLSFIDVAAICSDLNQFISTETDGTADGAKAEGGDKEKDEEGGSTDYVAERMAELVIAVQSPGENVTVNGETEKPTNNSTENTTATVNTAATDSVTVTEIATEESTTPAATESETVTATETVIATESATAIVEDKNDGH
eukprot:TRINITY_DN10883_c0_g1_i1.p1 TRINITY_DN10883_c0_g1~~TRINITY_DN10883_c0_g1_i1.p1  ORF type:complete len:655 (+),score=138.28 TRINITY_DN10883_c0_g1_i1:26-1990(+)